MATYHCSVKRGNKGSGASSFAKADYICREGKYKDKPDLEHSASGNMPEWAQEEPRTFWKAADEYERANARVYSEIEVALPREISPEQRQELVKNFIKEQLGEYHPYSVAIHNPPAALDGGEQPHAHIVFSERKLDGIGRAKEQFFKRANAKEPEKGGTAKDPTWHEREKVQQIRESWEQHYNRHSPEQVSCRSLKEQGIDREPERHLGPKMARPDAPEAGRVMETRGNLKKLEEIEREMTSLSREIKLDQERQKTPEYRMEPIKVKISEVLSEAGACSLTLYNQGTTRESELSELRGSLTRPYYKEAVEEYVDQKYRSERVEMYEKWNGYDERVTAYNEAVENAGWIARNFKDFKTPALKLEKDRQEIINRQTELEEKESSDKEKLLGSDHWYVQERREVNRLAEKLLQERDPQGYENTQAAIQTMEDRIKTERLTSLPERNELDKLCRNLRSFSNSDQTSKYLEVTFPVDRAGKRLTLEQALSNPATREITGKAINSLNNSLELYHKERDRGMVR